MVSATRSLRFPPALVVRRLSRSGVERVCHSLEIFDAVLTEVGALGEILTEPAIGIFVGTSLPREWGSLKLVRRAMMVLAIAFFAIPIGRVQSRCQTCDA